MFQSINQSSFGVGATASLFVATAAKEPAFGSLLSISIAYGLGLVFGLLCAAPTSGLFCPYSVHHYLIE